MIIKIDLKNVYMASAMRKHLYIFLNNHSSYHSSKHGHLLLPLVNSESVFGMNVGSHYLKKSNKHFVPMVKDRCANSVGVC